MTIICLDTCQAFSAPTCPTSSLCPLIARSLLAHTFASFVHTSTLASGPADAAAEECQTLRSHILRAEECQALRPLSSATGLGHRRGAPRHYITSGPRRVLHGLAAPDWRGDHECRARVVVHKDREYIYLSIYPPRGQKSFLQSGAGSFILPSQPALAPGARWHRRGTTRFRCSREGLSRATCSIPPAARCLHWSEPARPCWRL